MDVKLNPASKIAPGKIILNKRFNKNKTIQSSFQPLTPNGYSLVCIKFKCKVSELWDM